MASTAASKFVRFGNAPIRNLIHRPLQPTVTATASATAQQHGTAAFNNWNYLFPHTLGQPLGSKSNNQAISKLSGGNQFGLCGFSAPDDQSRVQVHAREEEEEIVTDTDDEEYDSDDDDFERPPSDDDECFGFTDDELDSDM